MRILYKIANKLFRIVKKILKLLTSRMVIIGVALLLEFCWLAGIVMQLNENLSTSTMRSRSFPDCSAFDYQ